MEKLKRYAKNNPMAVVMVVLLVLGVLLPLFLNKAYVLSILCMTVYVAG